MEGPRVPQEKEIPTLVQFLDSHLRPQESWSITSEYPLAFSESNRSNIRIITDQDQVLSHALIRPIITKSPLGLVKVAGIGSVVTSTEHRKQGLSSTIIESCLQAAKDQGCEFAILWTNLYEFYQKMGFELAGTEISVLLDHEIEVADSGLKFLETAMVDAEAIHRLFSRHTVCSMRTAEETRKYLRIPNMRVYTAWDSTGALKAYAVEGKGADLNGYVHEWGGGVSSLIPLFAHIRKTQNRPITIIVPRHSENLIRACEEKGMRIHEGFLGMIKLLDPTSLFTKIKRHARSIGISDLVLEQQEKSFYIGVRDNVLVTESEQDVIKLLFGPLKASEVQMFSKETAEVLERILPIDMWVWGWDSV